VYKRQLLVIVNVLGGIPFAAIGLYVGTLVGGNAAPTILNLLYLPMAFLSGLWLPLTMLPAILGKLAVVWPAYHLGQIALKVVGHDAGQPLWLHATVLGVAALVFFMLAQRRLSAAE
jgi:ABC-2 type transport system permease protein